MNRTFALAATLLTCTNIGFAGGPNGILSVEGPLPLKLEQAPRLVKPCWGSGPNPEGQLWLPTAAEVAALETRLEKYMTTVKFGTRAMPAADVKYRGQYVGFMRSKVKHIYASYVPERDSYPLPVGVALLMCDGGPSYWGIVYNTATGRFSELSISGRFGG